MERESMSGETIEVDSQNSQKVYHTSDIWTSLQNVNYMILALPVSLDLNEGYKK